MIDALIGLAAVDDPSPYQRIGAPALRQVFDFARWSRRERARAPLMDALAVVGQGDKTVLHWLADDFARLTGAQTKACRATALALTHDPRAIPLMADTLRDPALSEADARKPVEALKELKTPLRIDRRRPRWSSRDMALSAVRRSAVCDRATDATGCPGRRAGGHPAAERIRPGVRSAGIEKRLTHALADGGSHAED